MEIEFASGSKDGIVDHASLGSEFHVRLVANADGTVTAHATGACSECDGYGHIETVVGMTWAEGPVTAMDRCENEECKRGEVAIVQEISADDVEDIATWDHLTDEQRAFFAAAAGGSGWRHEHYHLGSHRREG